MFFWLIVCFLGLLAGFFVPAAWFFLQSIHNFLFNFESPIFVAFFTPFAAAITIYTLFYSTKTYRTADSFTFFFSDFHYREGSRSIQNCLAHGVATFFLLLGGGVVGLEALCFEWISGIGSWVGNRVRLTSIKMQALNLCGLSVGVAAMLGQPITALLFVVELLFGWGGWAQNIAPLMLSAFIASSVSSTLVSPSHIFHTLMGTDGGISFFFRGVSLKTDGLLYGGVFIVFFAAALAILTIWCFYKTDSVLHSFSSKSKRKGTSYKALGIRLFGWALLTGIVFYKSPDLVGSGATLLKAFAWESTLLYGVILILLIRLLLGTFSYAVIGSMGLLLPTLIFGILMGFCISIALEPYISLQNTSIMLLSMGAYFGAAFGTPLTATALVYAYSGSTASDSIGFFFGSIVMNFAAHFLCGLVYKDRLATLGLYRHDIRFRNGICFNTLSSVVVKDALISQVRPVSESSSVRKAYDRLANSSLLKLPVTDKEKKLLGMVSLSDFFSLRSWKGLETSAKVYDLLSVSDIMKPTIQKVYMETSLEDALLIMGDESLVPVVDEGTERFEGLLLKSDLMNLYNREVIKKAFNR